MTAKDLDEVKLRQELIRIYEKYLRNPKDRENLSEMDKIEQNYSGAHNFIKSKVINDAISLAGDIEEKEVSGSNIFLDRNGKEPTAEAKKILEALKSE